MTIFVSLPACNVLRYTINMFIQIKFMYICMTKGNSNIGIAKYILHVKSSETYLTLMIVLTEHRCNNPAVLSECR